MSGIAIRILCVGIALVGVGQAQKPESQETVDAQQLEQTLLRIQTATRYELPARVQALAKMAQAHDLVPILVSTYDGTPLREYATRRFLLGILGEFQDPRTLPFFVRIVSTKLPPGAGDPHVFDARAEEETVLVTAMHAVGYMRTAQARRVLLRTIRDHESYHVRAEAVSSYMWNSRDRSTGAAELLAFLPEPLRPVVTMPSVHAGMDRRAFDGALTEWREQWASPEH